MLPPLPNPSSPERTPPSLSSRDPRSNFTFAPAALPPQQRGLRVFRGVQQFCSPCLQQAHVHLGGSQGTFAGDTGFLHRGAPGLCSQHVHIPRFSMQGHAHAAHTRDLVSALPAARNIPAACSREQVRRATGWQAGSGGHGWASLGKRGAC